MKTYAATSFAAVVSLGWLGSTTAKSSFLARIPNGNLFGQTLGHTSATSSKLNAFGKAFEDADERWTTTLCKAKFPGTSITNGAAFGDPCCTWKPGATPQFQITPWTTVPTIATVCPPVTTAPPAVTTTAPPAVTTTAPPAVTTTAPPAVTTTAPPAVTTTAPPAVTTTAPPAVTTTAPPAATTTAPPAVTTTAPPAVTTTAPPAVTTTAPPAVTTTAPTTTTVRPIRKTTRPPTKVTPRPRPRPQDQNKPVPTKRLRQCESFENIAVDEDGDSE